MGHNLRFLLIGALYRPLLLTARLLEGHLKRGVEVTYEDR
jgi:hypothetical protein